MSSRLLAVAAVAIAVAFGAVGYAIGVGGKSLSEGQRAEVEQAVAVALEQDSGEDEAPATPVDVAGLSEDQRSEVETLIRDHLIANPEIIADAITALQARQEAEEVAAQASAIEDNAEVIFSSSRQVVIGNQDGDVTLVEFFDYNCSFCRRSATDVQELMAEDPDLRVVLKEFPVLGEGSIEAARVSIAVSQVSPETFRDFHFTLLSEPGQVDGERALAVAEELGVDVEAVGALIDSDEVSATINEVYEVAGKLNLTGTPTFVTAQDVVVGAVGTEALRAKLSEVRAN